MQEPTTDELWWAQQIQREYLARMKASRPNFTLNGTDFTDATKWVTPARHAIQRNIQPQQFVEMVFLLESFPVPWKFVKLSGKLKGNGIQMRDTDMTQEEYLIHKLRWSMQQFADFGEVDSPEYIEALVDIPASIGVPAWVRVLIGLKYPEVLRVWLPEALLFFQTRPDIVQTCKNLGFPHAILVGQTYA